MNLKQYRENKLMTIEEVAKKTRMKYMTYYQKETNRRNWKRREVERLAKVFNEELDIMLDICRNVKKVL